MHSWLRKKKQLRIQIMLVFFLFRKIIITWKNRYDTKAKAFFYTNSFSLQIFLELISYMEGTRVLVSMDHY